jgi:hypothetical protein
MALRAALESAENDWARARLLAAVERGLRDPS